MICWAGGALNAGFGQRRGAFVAVSFGFSEKMLLSTIFSGGAVLPDDAEEE